MVMILGGSGTVNATSTFALSTNNANRIYADTNGNVGIGTINPNEKFEVMANTTGGIGAIRVSTQYGAGYFGSYNNYPAIMYKSGSDWTPTVVYDTNNHLNQFYTNNVERMRIDSSGRITKPYQPAFVCYAAAGSNYYSAGNKILFNKTPILNNGNCYSSTNSRFTAPVTGAYMIKAQFWSPASGSPSFRFRVNGSEAYGAFGNEGVALSWVGFAAVEIMYLNANDYVECYTRSASVYTDGDYSTFSGYLLG